MFIYKPKHITMKRIKSDFYLSPEVEVMDFVVERGFGDSLGGVDPNPTNPGENPSLPGTDEEW